jgi:hypothetical protein
MTDPLPAAGTNPMDHSNAGRYVYRVAGAADPDQQ